MDLCVIGAGYVGLATAAVLANLGYRVICADTDADKTDRLNAGDCPIDEPNLPQMLRRNLADRRLSFTTDTTAAVCSSDIVFIAVGTPLDANGCANLSQLHAAALDIARALDGHKLIVNKSTVPVGTGNILAQLIRDNAPSDAQFDFCCNPEFLREGCALQRNSRGTQPVAVLTLAEGLCWPLRQSRPRRESFRRSAVMPKTPWLLTNLAGGGTSWPCSGSRVWRYPERGIA